MWLISSKEKCPSLMRVVQKSPQSEKVQLWECSDGPIVAAAQVSSSLLLLASCTTSRTSTVTKSSSTRVWTSCNKLVGKVDERTVCVHLVWEKVSVEQSQRRDQNLGITCLEINNRTVKQWQCLWTRNLVSKQDFVKAIRRQPLVVLKIWRQPPVVLPLQKRKDLGLCR